MTKTKKQRAREARHESFPALIESIELPGFTFTAIPTFAVGVKMDVGTGGWIGFAEETPDDIVLDGCLMVACKLAIHEIQEQFKVAGETYWNPHREGDAFGLSPKCRKRSTVRVGEDTP